MEEIIEFLKKRGGCYIAIFILGVVLYNANTFNEKSVYGFLGCLFLSYVAVVTGWYFGKTNTDKTFNEKAAERDKVKNHYASLLEDLAFMVHGCPDRLLVYSKNQIEEVLIQDGVIALISKDERKWNNRMVCYMLLAKFIPSEKYNKVKAIYDIGKESKMTEVEAKELVETLARILQEISVETNERGETFIRKTAFINPGAVEEELAKFRTQCQAQEKK